MGSRGPLEPGVDVSMKFPAPTKQGQERAITSAGRSIDNTTSKETWFRECSSHRPRFDPQGGSPFPSTFESRFSDSSRMFLSRSEHCRRRVHSSWVGSHQL